MRPDTSSRSRPLRVCRVMSMLPSGAAVYARRVDDHVCAGEEIRRDLPVLAQAFEGGRVHREKWLHQIADIDNRDLGRVGAFEHVGGQLPGVTAHLDEVEAGVEERAAIRRPWEDGEDR